jgi:hypothetical protein
VIKNPSHPSLSEPTTSTRDNIKIGNKREIDGASGMIPHLTVEEPFKMQTFHTSKQSNFLRKRLKMRKNINEKKKAES